MIHRRTFLSTSAAALLVGCGPRGTFTAATGDVPATSQRILMATNRASLTDTSRSTTLTFTDLDVAVPRDRTPGEVITHGPNAFAINSHTPVQTDAQIRAVLGPARGDPLVVWVHGFNNTPAEAIYRHAQIIADTGLRGPQVAFVWPSAANARGYLFDRDSALQARTALEDLLLRLHRLWPGKITIAAHSMGGFLTMEALTRVSQNAPAAMPDRLVLLQPDISPDVFASQIEDIKTLPRDTLLVVSSADPVLSLSATLAESPNRVGATSDASVYEAMGIRVIDVTHITDAASPHLVSVTSPTFLAILRAENAR